LINAWLATQGRIPESFNAVERLCYTGTRGMGALEFFPALGPVTRKSSPIEVEKLVELASEVLTHRSNLQVSFHDKSKEEALKDILRVGTSAGGARAKAVISWNPQTNEVRSGQVKTGDGFECWLIKFDGVGGNKDKELEDPQGYGAIEYAYYQMAKDAGIKMSKCRLFEENGRRHFMTKRFDRLESGEKLHMQSLCGLAHYDFNQAGAYGYEQALQVIRQLGLPMSSVEEQFRRLVFNILARNQDDHVKNIAFLMDKSGRWSLSPAFDMIYSFQPTGKWTSVHQMTLNGKRDGFTLEDFKACAKSASMKRGRAEIIINEVREVVNLWRDYADEVGVLPLQRDQIEATLRVKERF
ncbi:MAG: type II toxin-antitoxin system HipA family toxin, partial [Deltaproteobacteria bacterium]|nr:type II toxin-antitoxin system HipA family toxin [Deltaproteobacteria bacterium]